MAHRRRVRAPASNPRRRAPDAPAVSHGRVARFPDALLRNRARACSTPLRSRRHGARPSGTAARSSRSSASASATPGCSAFAFPGIRTLRRSTCGSTCGGASTAHGAAASCFVRELAAKRAVAVVARWFYGERFRRVPLRCRIDRRATATSQTPTSSPPRAHRVRLARPRRRLSPDGRRRSTAPQPPQPDSLAEFVVEHYWAYTARPPRRRQRVSRHPPARGRSPRPTPNSPATPTASTAPDSPRILRGEPASAFWADGSPVRVYTGRHIKR